MYRKGYRNNEDAIQAAFTQLVELREELRPGVQLKGLLFRIAYRRRLDEFRKVESKGHVSLDADSLDSMANLDSRGNALSGSWGNRSNSPLLELMAQEAFRSAFGKLSPDHQQALKFRLTSDQPVAVLAEKMGVSENRVSVFTTEAKDLWKKLIGPDWIMSINLRRVTLASLFPKDFNESDPDAPPNPEGEFRESP